MGLSSNALITYFKPFLLAMLFSQLPSTGAVRYSDSNKFFKDSLFSIVILIINFISNSMFHWSQRQSIRATNRFTQCSHKSILNPLMLSKVWLLFYKLCIRDSDSSQIRYLLFNVRILYSLGPLSLTLCALSSATDNGDLSRGLIKISNPRTAQNCKLMPKILIQILRQSILSFVNSAFLVLSFAVSSDRKAFAKSLFLMY